jgi:hypothetical protein
LLAASVQLKINILVLWLLLEAAFSYRFWFLAL